jgi:hypothetical protein
MNSNDLTKYLYLATFSVVFIASRTSPETRSPFPATERPWVATKSAGSVVDVDEDAKTT